MIVKKHKYTNQIWTDPVQQETRPLSEKDSSSDEDDLAYVEALAYKRKPYCFRVRRIIELAMTCSDEEFHTYYRMSRECFQKLLELVQDYYPIQGESINGKSLQPDEKLLIFLFHIGSGMRG